MQAIKPKHLLVKRLVHFKVISQEQLIESTVFMMLIRRSRCKAKRKIQEIKYLPKFSISFSLRPSLFHPQHYRDAQTLTNLCGLLWSLSHVYSHVQTSSNIHWLWYIKLSHTYVIGLKISTAACLSRPTSWILNSACVGLDNWKITVLWSSLTPSKYSQYNCSVDCPQ